MQPLTPTPTRLRAAVLAAAACAFLALFGHGVLAAPSAVLYDDALRWNNWSWGTTLDAAATSPVHEGAHSLRVSYGQAWAGLSLHAEGFDTTPYSHLQLAIHPDGPLPKLRLGIQPASGAPTTFVPVQPYATALGDGWHLVSVPLADPGVAGDTVSRVTLQEAAGAPPPPFHLDAVAFTSGSPPPPPPAAVAVVYDDALRWSNWSWGATVDPNAAAPVHAGSRSMAVTYQAKWAGLSLHTPALDTAPYDRLRFAIHPNGPQFPLSLGVQRSGGATMEHRVSVWDHATPSTGGWYVVSVPLSTLGVAGTTVTRVTLQDGGGPPAQTFYVDDLVFDGSGGSPPTPALHLYDDALRWANWSWSTSLDPAASAPVHSGSASMAVTYQAPWAGLSLHNAGVDTTPYTHLRLLIHASGALPRLSLGVHLEGQSAPANRVIVGQYAMPAGDGWHVASVPLSALGASEATVSRVTLQEASGAPPGTFHVDDLAFVAQGGTQGFTAYFMDAGPADATLIVSASGEALLVDGSGSRTLLRDRLERIGASRVDAVLATHPHDNHVEGLPEAFAMFDVDRAYWNGQASANDSRDYAPMQRFLDAVEAEGASLTVLRRGDRVPLAGLDVQVLHPGPITGNANRDSIVLRVSCGSVSMLLMGDADDVSEHDMLDAGVLDGVDLLKVGHHGAADATTQEFLDTVRPEVAVISWTRSGAGGVPSQAVIDRLENAGATVHRTDVAAGDDTLRFWTDCSQYTVSR